MCLIPPKAGGETLGPENNLKYQLSFKGSIYFTFYLCTFSKYQYIIYIFNNENVHHYLLVLSSIFYFISLPQLVNHNNISRFCSVESGS